MKVSELQLDDYVSCLGDPVRVVSLSLKDDEPIDIMSPLKTIETFREENVEPIPLTYDIINNVCEQDGRKNVEWYFSEDEPKRWRLSIAEELFMPSIDIYISYVHELQHALRLVGLKELAKNIKI